MCKNDIKSNNEILEKLFNTVSYGKYFWLRDEILKRCDVSKAVLRFWRTGVTPVPLLAKEKIEQIVAELEGIPEKHLFPELHQPENRQTKNL